MATLFETREEWLQAATTELRTVLFSRTDLSVPEVRIGVGWPSGGMRTRTGGQTWARAASADGINEITVRVDIHDAVDVLSILGHELIHAALDCKGAHGKMFQRAFFSMGYVNDPKASVPGAALRIEYALLAQSLGDYPSADGLALAAKKKKQTTRMIAFHCDPKKGGCTYAVSTTRVHIEIAVPICANPECERFHEDLMLKNRECNENGGEED